jgi:hypothetical protein
MTKNVGSTERLLRIILGLVLLSLLFLVEGQARWWGLLGLVPILTALISWCPINAALGSSSYKGPAS